MIPMWKLAPALACGNAFILKPSERDPSVPMMLAALLKEAGLPDGLLQVVNVTWFVLLFPLWLVKRISISGFSTSHSFKTRSRSR